MIIIKIISYIIGYFIGLIISYNISNKKSLKERKTNLNNYISYVNYLKNKNPSNTKIYDDLIKTFQEAEQAL